MTEWIPVTEALPEPGGLEMMVTMSDGQVWASFYEKVRPSFHGGGWTVEGRSTLTVVAWMPRPEPYTTEDTE